MGSSNLSRRNSLKYLGLLAASVAGRQFLMSWLPRAGVAAAGPPDLVLLGGTGHEHTEPEKSGPYTPQYFNPGEFLTVDILTEMIIPADGKPGASEARVADYIDFVVFSASEFQPTLQRDWREGLRVLEELSQRSFHKSFREVSGSERVKLLTAMGGPERDSNLQHEGFEFYKLVKGMTVEGFYTSKIGLIDVLDYQGMNYNTDFPGCTHPDHQS